MRVEKRVLADLHMVYAVCTIQLESGTHFMAATEAEGGCLLFSPPEWTASAVWDGPGGTTSLATVPSRHGALVAVEEHLPVFQAETAGVVYAETVGAVTALWRVRRVFDFPFVHRVDVVTGGATAYVVAASVCSGKDFRDDWSRPGAVYAGAVPERPDDPWRFDPVLQGVSKNHGMHVTRLRQRAAVLIAGEEGLFALFPPDSADASWESERLLERPVSDVYTADLDGDGVLEMVTIEPFHGDALKVYRQSRSRWQTVYEHPLDFGHVAWAGEILDRPAVLAGSRAGEKELTLLLPSPDLSAAWEQLVLDRNIGPAQVAVLNEDDRGLILSANHAAGQAMLYTVSA